MTRRRRAAIAPEVPEAAIFMRFMHMHTCLASRRRIGCRLALATFLIAGAAGCDWLVPLAFFQHKEKIPPEFGKLGGERVALVIWAAQETLFDYPHVRMELALHIADHIGSNVEDVDLIDGRLIEDYLERSLSTATDPEDIGKEFDCGYVIYIELLEFQMRDPEAPDLLRGKIASSVTVYDMKADPDEARQYELAAVEALYPEHAPLLLNETNALIVRKQAYEKYSEMVARKFYEHEVEM